MSREAADLYLYPPTLDSVESTWTLPPSWSLLQGAPCQPWLPDLLRRGWQIGPPHHLAPYYTARRVFGSPVAIMIVGIVTALLTLTEAAGGGGVAGAIFMLLFIPAVYLGVRVSVVAVRAPGQQERAAIPEVLQAYARDSRKFAPPDDTPEGRMLLATVGAIRHIASSPAWRSSMVQARNRQVELNLISEWSEVRYRVGRIREIRNRILTAAHMPPTIRQELESQMVAILTATGSRVRALTDYSNSLRKVEVCLQALQDAHTGEKLRAELGDLLAETAGDTHLAEGTRQSQMDLDAAHAGLEAALTAMSDQADFLRTRT